MVKNVFIPLQKKTMERWALLSRDEPGITYLGSTVSEVKGKLLLEHEGYTDRYCALLKNFCEKDHVTCDDLAEEWNSDDELNINYWIEEI